MGRKSGNGTDRARMVLAQEAARIIVEQGISDYRLAKHKAAERLGMSERGSLPGNSEIEQAVADYQQLFLGETHWSLLETMRRAALAAMELLDAFTPRVTGPVLHGTAGVHSAVDLHGGVSYRPFDRRLKSRRGRSESYAGLRFMLMETPIEATVFPFDGIRQAPISPVDGRPMRRADARALREMLGG
jgi:hypothetical protein